MKMNIAILHRNHSLPGGRTTFVNNLVNGLPKTKYKFHVINPKNYRSTAIGLVSYYADSLKELKKINAKNKIDLIICIGVSSLGGVLFGRKHRIPVMINLSDTNTRAIRQKKHIALRAGVGSIITSIAERTAFKLCNLITVPSDYAKKALMEDFPINSNKITIVNEGTSVKKLVVSRKQHGFSAKDKIILFPRTSERKNLDFFVSCLPEIMQIPNAKVVFWGDEKELNADHAATISKYGRRIVFGGANSQKKRDESLAISDLMIYPVTSEAHSYSVLEAVQTGLPVLMTRIGWLEDEFGGLGDFFINPKPSCKELVQKINYFFNNKKKVAQKFSSIKKKLLQKYNMKIMLDTYQKLFNHIVARK